MKRLFFLLLTLPLFLGSSSTSTKVNFYKGNLTKAKERAAQEGKLYFVDFMARWCMPCRWMDETTFSDARVARYISDHYIPVKVDIDDFDGYAYKQMYDIKLLPSIMIFNAKGEVVAKYEESLPPSKLLKILAKYNTPENRIGDASRPLPLMREEVPTESYVEQAPSRPVPYTRPSLPVETTPAPRIQTAPPVQMAPRPNIPKQETPIYNTSSSTSITRTNTTNPSVDELAQGLYRFKVSRQASQGFSVQIGVFGQYGNVLREAAKLEELFNQPIIVQIGDLNGKTVYKVMVGEFSSREAAVSYREQMKRQKVNGIIKDLSTMG